LLKGVKIDENEIEEAKNFFLNLAINVYVTDTHDFLWLLTEDNRLDKNARKFLNYAISDKKLLLFLV